MKASDQLIEQINGLGTTERTDFLGQLPQDLSSEDQKHLATSSLGATKDGARVDVIKKSAKDLSKDDQQIILNALDRLSPKIRDQIWKIVIWAFVTLVVGSFLVLSASLFLCAIININDAHIQIIVTVFTTAAAFLTGLLAPSPMTKQVS